LKDFVAKPDSSVPHFWWQQVPAFLLLVNGGATFEANVSISIFTPQTLRPQSPSEMLRRGKNENSSTGSVSMATLRNTAAAAGIRNSEDNGQ
jgi:hypothetical protein